MTKPTNASNAKIVRDCTFRRVKVNRTRSPGGALEATGCAIYFDPKVVAAMPRGEGDEAEVAFFTLGRFIRHDDLEAEYAKRGLVPVDPYSLAAVNEDSPSFAVNNPNGTYWKNSEGHLCFALFYHHGGYRVANVDSDDSPDWCDIWWFAGVRK